MSKQAARRNPPKRRPQARKGRTAVAARSARRNTDYTAWIIALIILVVGGALVFVFASNNGKNGPPFIKGRKPAPAALVKKVVDVPESTITAVGQGSAGPLPSKLPGPALTANGKPRIVYIGAEYCPYCAAERWAMLQAFSRFGTFSNVNITSSAKTAADGSPEVNPNTQTLSFYKSTYTSKYIDFESVEVNDNSDHTLETPTQEQAQLETKYDTQPYVNTDTPGGIPFIDFANQYVISGATYDPAVLAGQTHSQIAAAMWKSSTDISKGAVGTANVITATVCKVTNNQPSNVCTNAAVSKIESQLPS